MAFVIVVEAEKGIDVRTLRSREDHHCHCGSSSRSDASERVGNIIVCGKRAQQKRECKGRVSECSRKHTTDDYM